MDQNHTESPHKDSHLVFVEEKGVEDSEPSPNTHDIQMVSHEPPNLKSAIERMEATKGEARGDLDMSSESKQFRKFGSEIHAFFAFFPLAIKTSVAMAVVGLIAAIYNASVCTAFSDEAHGMNVVLARSTIGGIEASADNNHSALVFNQFCMVCILILGFILAFKWKGLEKSINKGDSDTLAHHSGRIIKKPKETTVEAVADYLAQFGRVTQVVRFRNLGQTVKLAKDMFEMRDSIRYLRSLQQQDSQIEKELRQLQSFLQKTELKLVNEVRTVNETTKDSVLFIAIFERAQDAEKCLQVLQQYSGYCTGDAPEQLQLNGKKVKASQLTSQPSQLIWQNQHITAPFLPAFCLLILINVLAFAVIGVLGILSAAHYHVYYFPELQTNSVNATAIQAQTNTTVIASWCLSNTPTTQTESLCGSYLELQSDQMWTYFWVAVSLIFGAVMMKYFFHWYVRFFRFSLRTEERDFVFQQVLIHYLVVAVALALSIQTNVFGQATVTMLVGITRGDAKRNLQSLQQYYDYQPEWYLDYGYQIILDYVLFAFLPHLLRPVFSHLLQRFKISKARSQPTQQAMQRTLALQQYEVADHYAATFMLFGLGLVFAGAMPIMLVIMPFAVAARYLVAKYLFIYSYKVPPPAAHLNRRIFPALILMLTLYVTHSVWAYGMEDIFPLSIVVFPSVADREENAHNPLEALMVFCNRLGNTWVPVAVYFIGLLVVLKRDSVLSIYYKIIGEREERGPEIQMKEAPVIAQEMSNSSEQGENALPRSYAMHNCPAYQQVWQQLRDRNVI